MSQRVWRGRTLMDGCQHRRPRVLPPRR
jgi:hypothetical protein